MSAIPATSFTSPYTKFQAHQTIFKFYLAVSCCTPFMWAILCLRCPPFLCLTNSPLSFRHNSNFVSSLTTLSLVPMFDRTYHIMYYIFSRSPTIQGSLRALKIFYLYFMCLAHSGTQQTFVNEHINNWVIKEKVDLFMDLS